MTVYRSPMSRWVVCSACGRRLRGQQINIAGFYTVRPHYVTLRSARDVRRTCEGSGRFDHRPFEMEMAR